MVRAFRVSSLYQGIMYIENEVLAYQCNCLVCIKYALKTNFNTIGYILVVLLKPTSIIYDR